MPKGKNQKLKLYYLKKILLELTDDEHSLSMQEILEELEKYGVTTQRKTIYDDIDDLKKFGITVTGHSEGKSYQYWVTEREFELAELKLLVDAVQSSKFISETVSNELIHKLEGFASRYDRTKLNRQVFVQGRPKTTNNDIYKTVDVLHTAIAENKKIKFKYGQWNINKKLELRKGGQFYKISPWYLAWADENYYLIGYDSEADMVKHYRVDKMTNAISVNERRAGRAYFEKFNLAEYCRKNFSMFDGREETVTVRIENSMVGIFFDRYGKDILAVPVDETHSDIHLDVKVNEQFLGWLFALGSGVKLTGPASALEDAKKMLERIGTEWFS